MYTAPYHLHKCRARIHLQPFSGLFAYPSPSSVLHPSLSASATPVSITLLTRTEISQSQSPPQTAFQLPKLLGPGLTYASIVFWAKSGIVVIDWLAIQLSTERNQIGLCKQWDKIKSSREDGNWDRERVRVEMSREIWFTAGEREKNREKCILLKKCHRINHSVLHSRVQIKVHQSGNHKNFSIIRSP